MPTLNIVPPKLDIVAYGGDDTKIAFNLTDGNGDVVALVGEHTSQIRPDANSKTYWDLTVTLDSEVSGRATITVPSEVAAELVVDATMETIYVGDDLVSGPMFIGVWDWQYNDNGEIRTMVHGDITVIGEVTK